MRLAVLELGSQWGLYHVTEPNETHRLLERCQSNMQAEEEAIALSNLLASVEDPQEFIQGLYID